MTTTATGKAVAILAQIDQATLAELTVSDHFAVIQGGDAERIRALLAESVDRIDSRVAVASYGAARIDGFLCATEPNGDSPMYSVAPAIELVAFEVATPHRRLGLFTAMFQAMFRRDLESWIIYVVADPEQRDRKESVRAFRQRIESVLGSLGFAPLPTDDPSLHPRPDSALFVRVGRGVPTPDVEDFFKRLRSSACATVAISLKTPLIRTLLRDDLERCGFMVRSVSAGGSTEPADILITDNGGTPGRLVTVRLDGSLELHWRDGTLWYPLNMLDRLGNVLRTEIEARRRDVA